ncbi:MAG TPA: Gfo/Idh/MocA family oxidoreductase [Aldersonia sp.]
MSRRVLVVGAGLASAAHLTALRRVGARVVGVVTRDPARAEAARRLAPDAQIFATVDAAATLAADTALIVTPPSSHLSVADALARRGLDLIVDKPLATTLSQAQGLIEIAERCGVRSAITLQHRYKPAATVARRLLVQKAIGTLRAATITVPLWRPDTYYAEPGRGTWARDGGGALITQAIHTLDVYVSLVGRPQRVTALAHTSRHRLEAEDTIHLLLDHGHHAASMTASTAAWPGSSESIHLYGDSGQLVLDGDSLTRIGSDVAQLVTGGVDGSGPDPLAMATWFTDLYTDVFDSWAAGTTPDCAADSALAVQAVIEAAYASARSGMTPMTVPNTERRTPACPTRPSS